MTTRLDGLDWWLAVGSGMAVLVAGLFGAVPANVYTVLVAVFVVYASLPIWTIVVRKVRRRNEDGTQ